MSRCHASNDAVPAPSAAVRDLLSLKEVVVLADIPEERVRKDIETKLIAKPRLVAINNPRLCFTWAHIFMFAAVYSNKHLTGKLRKLALNKMEHVNEKFVIHTATDRSHWVSFNCCKEGVDTNIWLDRFVSIDIGRVCHSIEPRVTIYSNGLSKIEEKDDILGGNAVFNGTRLSVAHIGKMAERGESVRDIIEDYPYLNEHDVDFARLYYRAHPSLGRPKSGDRSNAKADFG